MSKLSNNTVRNWFAKTETLLLASSLGSSVAAIIFQQVAFVAITSIPLSLAISLNSSNRKRLEELEQQHKASLIQLEQKFAEKQESTNNVLYSLPTRSDLLEIKKGLEDYSTAFTEQLSNLDKHQASVNVKLQHIDSESQQFIEVQQRICVLENLLQSYNPTHLNPKLQKTLFNIEGKIEKLEKQFNNLALPDLQYQLKQVQRLVEKLQISNTESTQANKYFSGKIEDLSQQIQSTDSRNQELSLAHTEIQNQLSSLKAIDVDKIQEEIKLLLFNDFHANNKSSVELNQHLVDKVESLQQQVQAVSNSVSERIQVLQVALQTQRLFIEKSEHKIHEDLYELADWHKSLEAELKSLVAKSSSTPKIQAEQYEIELPSTNKVQRCDHCHQNYEHQPIEGGYSFNNKFCRTSCKNHFELTNGLSY